MTQIMTETRTIYTEKGTNKMQYELLMEEATGGVSHYGAAVTNVRTGEHMAVERLTSDPLRAATFFERITCGLVTPVTFMDVAEDFVAE